jgi:hypothetical protein
MKENVDRTDCFLIGQESIVTQQNGTELYPDYQN